MALPPEIITAQVNFGPFVDDHGVPYEGSVTFSSSAQKIWQATGTPIMPRPVKFPLDPDGMGVVRLPVNDQPGYVNHLGEGIVGWTYSASIELVGGPRVRRRVFSLQANGAVDLVVDLDRMVQAATTAGIATSVNAVLSVNGMTGHVDIRDLVYETIDQWMADNS